MFDLDQQIDRWKSAFAKQAACSSDELLELESHLREDIAALVAAGAVIRGEVAARSAARAARRAVAGRRFAEAEESIGAWLRERPGAAEAHFLKARVALGLGRTQDAIDELARARALGHPDAPIDRLDAIIRAKAGRHAEAEPVLRRVLAGSTTPDPEAAEESLEIIAEEAERLGRLVGDVLQHVHDHDPVELGVVEGEPRGVDEVGVGAHQLVDGRHGLLCEVRRGPASAAPPARKRRAASIPGSPGGSRSASTAPPTTRRGCGG